MLDGKLFEGNQGAGAEFGHSVIVVGGEPCSCGRRGCLEAYASATALIRDTKRAMEAHPDSKMWEVGSLDKVDGAVSFTYAPVDPYAREVVDHYVEMLGSGMCNIANVFRPEAILIGGGVSAGVVADFRREYPASRAFHLSGKTVLDSGMVYRNAEVSMGLPGISEFQVWRTEEDAIRRAAAVLSR